MWTRIKNFLFVNSGTKQTIIKNTVWSAGSTTIIKIIRAVVIILVARTLGTEGYGIFTYALSLAGIVAIFSDIGLTGILTRELSKNKDKKTEYLSTILAVKLGFLLVATIVLMAIGPAISRFDAAKPLLIIIALSIAFESLRSFFYSITRSENKMQIEAGIGLFTEIISTILVVVIALHNPTPMKLAEAYMIGNALGLLACVGFLRNYFKNMWTSFRKELVIPIIRSAWPFAVMGVFGMFLTNIDALMIGWFGTAHDVGLYAAAQRPIGLLYILPNFIGMSIFPILSRAIENKDSVGTGKLLQKSYLVSMALALPLMACGIILAQPLINVAFEQAYIGAVASFQILLTTLLFIFPGTVFSDLIFAEDKQKIFIVSSAIGAVINVGLNFFLIPRFGIAGSAVATVVAQIFINAIFYYEIRKRHKLSLIQNLGKIIAATIGIAGLAYVLKFWAVPLIVIIPGCTLAYVGLLVFMKDELALEIRGAFKAQ